MKEPEIHIDTQTIPGLSKTEGEPSKLEFEQSANECHARLTTEANTDFLEKVVVTNDIVVAWPIRFACVHVQDKAKDIMKPETEESRPGSRQGDPLKRQSVSMSLRVDGLVSPPRMNIHARVRIRSPSPEHNVEINTRVSPLRHTRSPETSKTTEHRSQVADPTTNAPERQDNPHHVTQPTVNHIQIVNNIKINAGEGVSSSSKSSQPSQDTPSTHHGELIGGQAVVCLEHPQQLIESSQVSTSPIDLKIDGIQSGAIEDTTPLKLGHLQSKSSKDSDEIREEHGTKSPLTTFQPTILEEMPNNWIGSQPEMKTSKGGFVEPEVNSMVKIVASEQSNKPNENAAISTNISINIDNFRPHSVISAASSISDYVQRVDNSTTIEAIAKIPPEVQQTSNMEIRIHSFRGMDDQSLSIEHKVHIGVSYQQTDDTPDLGILDHKEEMAERKSENMPVKLFHMRKITSSTFPPSSSDRHISDIAQDIVVAVLDKVVEKVMAESEESAISTSTPAETLPYDKPAPAQQAKQAENVKDTEKLDSKGHENSLKEVKSNRTLKPDNTGSVGVRDAQVDARLGDISRISEDGTLEESEWSQSTHRYHYRHHRYNRSMGRLRPSDRPRRHSRTINHFGQGVSDTPRHRSNTIPRAYGERGLTERVRSEIRNSRDHQNHPRRHSDETSSDSITSETSELQRITMMLLNTLSTTAELLRNQYKRRKAHRKPTSGHRVTTNSGEMETDVIRNTSCAIPWLDDKNRSISHVTEETDLTCEGDMIMECTANWSDKPQPSYMYQRSKQPHQADKLQSGSKRLSSLVKTSEVIHEVVEESIEGTVQSQYKRPNSQDFKIRWRSSSVQSVETSVSLPPRHSSPLGQDMKHDEAILYESEFYPCVFENIQKET